MKIFLRIIRMNHMTHPLVIVFELIARFHARVARAEKCKVTYRFV